MRALAKLLNSVNLPDNKAVLDGLVAKSNRSFQGRVTDPFRREYVFVLSDGVEGKVLGTSMILAQHGTRESPHIYFQVSDAEHYSASIDKHFRHRVLSIGYNYEGPTEIGGLIVAPSARGRPGKPGKQLSYVRFLYIAMHRDAFRDRILAELMPPLLPDGRSLLWESIGKKFTGLDYREADALSRQNKEFIKELFPSSDIYATLLSPRARKLIGQVGEQTVAVQKMLERIGFTYAGKIDPFDGGPHYEAATSEVTLVRDFRWATVRDIVRGGDERSVMIGADGTSFRAVCVRTSVGAADVALSAEVRRVLGVRVGQTVGVLPFED